MRRLSDAQWDAAFSAGGYDPAVAARFKAALKSRIGQTRAMPAPPPAGPRPAEPFPGPLDCANVWRSQEAR